MGGAWEDGFIPSGSAEDRDAFVSALAAFIKGSEGGRELGSGELEIPRPDEEPLCLARLYADVCGKGGFDKVTSKGQWAAVAKALGLRASAGSQMKDAYCIFLHAFETRYFGGPGTPHGGGKDSGPAPASSGDARGSGGGGEGGGGEEGTSPGGGAEKGGTEAAEEAGGGGGRGGGVGCAGGSGEDSSSRLNPQQLARRDAAVAALRRPRARGRPSNAEYEARARAESDLTDLGITEAELIAMGVPGYGGNKVERAPRKPSGGGNLDNPGMLVLDTPREPRPNKKFQSEASDPGTRGGRVAGRGGTGGKGGFLSIGGAPRGGGRGVRPAKPMSQLAIKRLRAQQNAAAKEAAEAAVREAQETEAQAAALIQPSVGPYMLVPPHLATTHGAEIIMGLRSGVPEQIAWALNMLTWLSFDSRHEMLVSRCPGVVEALTKLLDAWHGVRMGSRKRKAADSAAQELSAFAPPPGTVRVVEGALAEAGAGGGAGRGGGWWWEREEGLLAPTDGRALQHAVCASNVLCNLSFVKENAEALSQGPHVSSLVACVEDRRETFDEEIAGNALECLCNVGGSVDLGLTTWKAGATVGRRLWVAIVRLLGGAGGGRCESLAAAAVAALCNNKGNAVAMSAAVAESRLVADLIDRLDIEEYGRGTFGGAGAEDEAAAAAAEMEQRAGAGAGAAWPGAEVEAAEAWVAAGPGGAAAAAAGALAALVFRVGPPAIDKLLGERQAITRVLRLVQPGATGVREAAHSAARLLAMLATHPVGRCGLKAHEGAMAEAAMSDGPASHLLTLALHQMAAESARAEAARKAAEDAERAALALQQAEFPPPERPQEWAAKGPGEGAFFAGGEGGAK